MRKYVIKDGRINGEVEDLLARPIVITVNDFNEDSVRRFSAGISRAHTVGQPIIPVVIDSYGGDAYALLAMVSMVESSKIPVAMIVEGKAMSCGAILFSCGAKGHRYMAPHARLMIHDVASYSEGKVLETRSNQQETDRLNDSVYKLMAKNAGQPPAYFLDLVQNKGHADWYLDAKEAKRHKLCDQIRVPELRTTISVDIALL